MRIVSTLAKCTFCVRERDPRSTAIRVIPREILDVCWVLARADDSFVNVRTGDVLSRFAAGFWLYVPCDRAQVSGTPVRRRSTLSA